MNYKDYFKDKKITLVGFGENNKALADAEFLAKAGATVTVLDARQEHELSQFIKHFKIAPPSAPDAVGLGGIALSDATANDAPDQIDAADILETISKKPKPDWREKVSFHFGKYKKELFEGQELIIRDISIPLSLPQFKEALNKNVPVEVAESLFVKLSPPITLVGVTGTCGKTTTAYMINEIVKQGFADTEQKFYFIDPYKGSSPLSLLGKVKRDDIILLETGTELLAEFNNAHMSPHVAVITNIYTNHLGHANKETYFEEKSAIFKYQTYNNFLIANDEVVDLIKTHFSMPFKAKILRTGTSLIPREWRLEDMPQHMKENMALALRVAEVLRVDDGVTKNAVLNFKNPKARQEYVKKVRGALFYNDSASTNPAATLTALKSLSKNRNAVLIFGGPDMEWNTKDMDDFMKTIVQYAHTLILLPGSGTMKMHRYILDFPDMKHIYAHSIYDAVGIARDNAGKEDVVIFSPGFPAWGLYQNEVERGDHFIWALRSF